jgi:hypothetical protein
MRANRIIVEKNFGGDDVKQGLVDYAKLHPIEAADENWFSNICMLCEHRWLYVCIGKRKRLSSSPQHDFGNVRVILGT